MMLAAVLSIVALALVAISSRVARAH